MVQRLRALATLAKDPSSFVSTRNWLSLQFQGIRHPPSSGLPGRACTRYTDVRVGNIENKNKSNFKNSPSKQILFLRLFVSEFHSVCVNSHQLSLCGFLRSPLPGPAVSSPCVTPGALLALHPSLASIVSSSSMLIPGGRKGRLF